MGMDVHGKSPKTKHGEYWRSSAFGWPDVWGPVCAMNDVHQGPLTERDQKACRYNDGHLIDEEKALTIGLLIKWVLADGRIDELDIEIPKGGTHAIAAAVVQSLGGLDVTAGPQPMGFDVEELGAFARFCIDSGGFEVW